MKPSEQLSREVRRDRVATVFVNERGFYPVAFSVGIHAMPCFVTFWDRKAAARAAEAWLSGARDDFYYGAKRGGPSDLDDAVAG